MHSDTLSTEHKNMLPQKIQLTAPLTLNIDPKKIPFFCRQEVKLEKAVHMPVLIRLGSVADCNYLEQKPGYTLR